MFETTREALEKLSNENTASSSSSSAGAGGAGGDDEGAGATLFSPLISGSWSSASDFTLDPGAALDCWYPVRLLDVQLQQPSLPYLTRRLFLHAHALHSTRFHLMLCLTCAGNVYLKRVCPLACIAFLLTAIGTMRPPCRDRQGGIDSRSCAARGRRGRRLQQRPQLPVHRPRPVDVQV